MQFDVTAEEALEILRELQLGDEPYITQDALAAVIGAFKQLLADRDEGAVREKTVQFERGRAA